MSQKSWLVAWEKKKKQPTILTCLVTIREVYSNDGPSACLWSHRKKRDLLASTALPVYSTPKSPPTSQFDHTQKNLFNIGHCAIGCNDVPIILPTSQRSTRKHPLQSARSALYVTRSKAHQSLSSIDTLERAYRRLYCFFDYPSVSYTLTRKATLNFLNSENFQMLHRFFFFYEPLTTPIENDRNTQFYRYFCSCAALQTAFRWECCRGIVKQKVKSLVFRTLGLKCKNTRTTNIFLLQKTWRFIN